MIRQLRPVVYRAGITNELVEDERPYPNECPFCGSYTFYREHLISVEGFCYRGHHWKLNPHTMEATPERRIFDPGDDI